MKAFNFLHDKVSATDDINVKYELWHHALRHSHNNTEPM